VKYCIFLITVVINSLCFSWGIFAATGEKNIEKWEKQTKLFIQPESSTGSNKDSQNKKTNPPKKDTKENPQINKKEEKKEEKNEESEPIERIDEKERIRQEINNSIIEAYKLQWSKILKDIDTTLQKMNLSDEEKLEAYDRIQETLEARKKKIQTSPELSEKNKDIIGAYLNYMITSLGKRKITLSDRE
jgi:hypothetical protein